MGDDKAMDSDQPSGGHSLVVKNAKSARLDSLSCSLGPVQKSFVYDKHKDNDEIWAVTHKCGIFSRYCTNTPPDEIR